MVSSIDTQVDWTVSRCNRLMRPLVTRIQKLRIIKEEKQTTRRTLKNSNKNVDDNLDREDSEEPRAQGKENDPDWISVPKKKKAKRGYSSRNTSTKDNVVEIEYKTPARANGRPKLQPGELAIPTPYLIRNPTKNEQSMETNNTKVHQDSSPSARGVHQVKKTSHKRAEGFYGKRSFANFQGMEDEFVLVQNVGKCFLDIISATNVCIDPQEQKTALPSRGTQSLYAMCLRKYGTIIGEEEGEQLSCPEETAVDNTAFRYQEAEQLDFLPERKPGGRLQLRLIVRAHAVQVMANAIEEGLIPREAVRLFVSQLLNPPQNDSAQSSRAEAEVLMSALIAAESPNSISKCATAHRNHFYAHVFSNAASQAGHVGETRLGFEFRQFTKVLRSRYVPIEWLATRRIMPLWTNVFRTLLDSSSSEDILNAHNFLRQALALAIGLEPSSRQAEKVLMEVPADFVQQCEACPKCPKAPFGSVLVNPTINQPLPGSDANVAKRQLANGLTNTLSSLSTLLSSFAIAHSINPADLPNVNNPVILVVLNTLSLEIVMHHADSTSYTRRPAQILDQSGAILADLKRSRVSARRAVSILASTLITQIAGCKLPGGLGAVPPNDLVRTMKKLDSTTRNGSADSTTILDCLPELVCSIARGIGQVLRADCFVTLSNIVRSIASPDIPGVKISSSTLLFLKQLAFSSAHHFVNETTDPTHYSLINDIEKEMGQTEHFDVSKTPFRSSTKGGTEPRGFRWEEGICEWVLATPKPKLSHESEHLAHEEVPDDDRLDAVSRPYAPAPEPADIPSSPYVDVRSTIVGNKTSITIADLLIDASSSPTHPSPSFPIQFGQNTRLIHTIPEPERIQQLGRSFLKFPILKRSNPSDDSSDDDELSMAKTRHRIQRSRSERHSGPTDRYKPQKSRRTNRNESESEDELSFV